MNLNVIFLLFLILKLLTVYAYGYDDRRYGSNDRGPSGSYSVDQFREQIIRQQRMQVEINNVKPEIKSSETRLNIPAYLSNSPVIFPITKSDSFNFRLASFYDNKNQNNFSLLQTNNNKNNGLNNEKFTGLATVKPDAKIQNSYQSANLHIDQYQLNMELDESGRIKNEVQAQFLTNKNDVEQFKGMEVLGIRPRLDVEGYELLGNTKFEEGENLRVPMEGLVAAPEMMSQRLESVKTNIKEFFQSEIKIHQEGGQYVVSGEKTALALVMMPKSVQGLLSDVQSQSFLGSDPALREHWTSNIGRPSMEVHHIELALTPESKLVVESKTEFPAQNLRVEVGRLWVNKEGALVPEEGTIYSRNDGTGFKLRLNGALEDIRIKSIDQEKDEFTAVIEKFREKDDDVWTGKLTASIELKGKISRNFGKAYLQDGIFVGGRMENGLHEQPVAVEVSNNNYKIVTNYKDLISKLDKELKGGSFWSRADTPRRKDRQLTPLIEKLETAQAQIEADTRLIPEKLSFAGLYKQAKQEEGDMRKFTALMAQDRETRIIGEMQARARGLTAMAFYPAAAVETGVRMIGTAWTKYTDRLFGSAVITDVQPEAQTIAETKVYEPAPEIKTPKQELPRYTAENKSVFQEIKNTPDERIGLTSPVDDFKQGVGWWAKTYTDHTKSYMRDTGCAVTIGAMIVNFFGNAFPELEISKTDPGKLNQSFIKLGEDGFNKKHDLRWDALRIISNGKIEALEQKTTGKFPLQQLEKFIDQDLENNKPVAIQVPKTSSEKESGFHWLLIIGKENRKYKIYDPGSKNIAVYEPHTTMERKLLNGKITKVAYGDIVKIQQFGIIGK